MTPHFTSSFGQNTALPCASASVAEETGMANPRRCKQYVRQTAWDSQVPDRYAVLLFILLPGSPRISGLAKYRCQHPRVTASSAEPSREGQADYNKGKEKNLHHTQNIAVKGDNIQEIIDNREQDNSAGLVRLNFP